MIGAADDQLTIFERSKPGRRAFVAPELDVPERPLDELLPPELRRAAPPRLPEVAEPEIVRHYNRLSKRNFDLDTGFYPLGSCTMKHNPKLHERIAALPGHARLHPLQEPRSRPGRTGADVAPAGRAGRDRRTAPRLAAAVGRIPRRAGRRAADAGLPRGSRRASDQGAHSGHRPRHESGHGHDGRLRGGQGRHRRGRQRRPRRSPAPRRPRMSPA